METATLPRFRTDLVAEPIDDNGQRYIDVIDPDTGNSFRFYEVEYSLACAMDGARDVAGLVTWAQEELGITPTSSELASVIATLGDLGYLELGAPPAATAIVAPRPPALDVELGNAGGGRRPVEPAPKAPDLELGVAGPSAAARVVAPAPSAADLGPAGPSMSKPAVATLDVDLSAGLAIGAADVKEAVRASKVMKAAELPPDLAAALDSAADEPIPAPERPAPVIRPPTQEPVRPVVRQTRDPAPARSKEPTRPPIELRDPPTAPQAAPVVEPPRRTNPVLVFLMVLLILGGIGFAFWKYYWVPRHEKAKQATSTPTPPDDLAGSGSAVPAPPPPPPPQSAVLAMSTPAPLEIQAPIAGAIASIAAAGAEVNQGDEIARFTGAEKLAADLKGAVRDLARVQGQLDKLTADNAAADQMKDRQDSLAEKQAEKQKLEGELEKLVVRAPASGVLAPVSARGKKVAANDVIATIQPASFPAATFELRADQSFAADQEVELGVTGGEQKLACKVAEVEGQKMIVRCPVEGAPADGTKVQLP